MEKRFKNIIIIILIFLLFVVGFKIGRESLSPKIDELKNNIKKHILKKDSLIKVNDSIYTRLVADTLTKKEMREKIDSLKLKIKDPEIVEKVVFKIKEVSKKEMDTIYKYRDSLIYVEDYYPKKENYFIKFSSKINTKTLKGVSNWESSPQEIRLIISEERKGLYRITSKVPEYLKITELEVQSLPLEKPKKDNFGVLVGGGYGKDLRDNKEYLDLKTGLRFKKTYLFLNIGTNETISASLIKEL